MSKETFKEFARRHPELAKTVVNGGASWQQLYEIYEIYGGEHRVWNSYFSTSSSLDSIATSASTFKDFLGSFKNLDMDSVQQGIQNIQKTIGLLQDIGFTKKNEYEPRPIYKRFEDS